MLTELPEIQYVENGDVSIAYQVIGDGEPTLIVLSGLFSNIDSFHELPGYTEALKYLSEFARIITFDKRGQGLSDRITDAPSLDERVSDMRAVMAAAGTERAAIMGCSDGGTMAMLFAATYPEKTSALILFGAFAKACAAEDFPHMPGREERWARINGFAASLGKGNSLNMLDPALANDEEVRALYGKAERSSTTPKGLLRYFNIVVDTDLRPILPSIKVPTLVLHHRDDTQAPFAAGQHLANSIQGAQFVDLGMGGHAFWSGNAKNFADHVSLFLGGKPKSEPVSDRVLATVMFTDIVGSTKALNDMGDAKWREILDRHDQIAAQLVRQYRGNMLKSTGDGILATFDGPGRAVQCAGQLAEEVEKLGLKIRTGIHTGEIETRGDDVSGIAVHTAARIMDEASPGQILASGIVAALVAGSAQIKFKELGVENLKGIPSPVQIMEASPNNTKQ